MHDFVDYRKAEAQIREQIGIKVDFPYLLSKIEIQYAPLFRAKIAERDLVGKPFSALVLLDYTARQTVLRCPEGEEVWKVLSHLFVEGGLKKEDVEASLFVWSFEKKYFPLVVVLARHDKNLSCVLNLRWSYEEDFGLQDKA